MHPRRHACTHAATQTATPPRRHPRLAGMLLCFGRALGSGRAARAMTACGKRAAQGAHVKCGREELLDARFHDGRLQDFVDADAAALVQRQHALDKVAQLARPGRRERREGGSAVSTGRAQSGGAGGRVGCEREDRGLTVVGCGAHKACLGFRV
eukprot:361084-Chlamydomonas_euryale.AAC.7